MFYSFIACAQLFSNDTLTFSINLDKSNFIEEEPIYMEFVVRSEVDSTLKVTALTTEASYSLQIELTRIGDTTFVSRGGMGHGIPNPDVGKFLAPREEIRHIFWLNYHLGYLPKDWHTNQYSLPPGDYKVVALYHSNPAWPYLWSQALRGPVKHDLDKLKKSMFPLRKSIVSDTLQFTIKPLTKSPLVELNAFRAAMEKYHDGSLGSRDNPSAVAALDAFYNQYPESPFNQTIIRYRSMNYFEGMSRLDTSILEKYSDDLFINMCIGNWIRSVEDAEKIASKYRGTRIEYFANKRMQSILWRIERDKVKSAR